MGTLCRSACRCRSIRPAPCSSNPRAPTFRAAVRQSRRRAPTRRTEDAMKFAFLSVTYSGQFYNGPALTVLEQIRKAPALGFDGLSIETKRPVASPLDLTRQDRQGMKPRPR